MTPPPVVVWDFCSDVMPWWYCALFHAPTTLVFSIVVGVLVAVTVPRILITRPWWTA